MTTVTELATAVETIHAKLTEADAACADAIASIILERDDLIAHISAAMTQAADHLEKHRLLIHSLVSLPTLRV